MTSSAGCPQCQALRDEIRSALAEFSSSPNRRSESREAVEAIRSLFGGTEEAVERAEQVLRKFRPQLLATDPESRPNSLGLAIAKLHDHQLRTGHKVLFDT